jgi:hypothetical protein
LFAFNSFLSRRREKQVNTKMAFRHVVLFVLAVYVGMQLYSELFGSAGSAAARAPRAPKGPQAGDAGYRVDATRTKQLWKAVDDSNLAFVRRLLAMEGVDPSWQGPSAPRTAASVRRAALTSALQRAIDRPETADSLAILTELLKHPRADPSRPAAPDLVAEVPLRVAVGQGKYKMMNILLAHPKTPRHLVEAKSSKSSKYPLKCNVLRQLAPEIVVVYDSDNLQCVRAHKTAVTIPAFLQHQVREAIAVAEGKASAPTLAAAAAARGGARLPTEAAVPLGIVVDPAHYSSLFTGVIGYVALRFVKADVASVTVLLLLLQWCVVGAAMHFLAVGRRRKEAADAAEAAAVEAAVAERRRAAAAADAAVEAVVEAVPTPAAVAPTADVVAVAVVPQPQPQPQPQPPAAPKMAARTGSPKKNRSPQRRLAPAVLVAPTVSPATATWQQRVDASEAAGRAQGVAAATEAPKAAAAMAPTPRQPGAPAVSLIPKRTQSPLAASTPPKEAAPLAPTSATPVRAVAADSSSPASIPLQSPGKVAVPISTLVVASSSPAVSPNAASPTTTTPIDAGATDDTTAEAQRADRARHALAAAERRRAAAAAAAVAAADDNEGVSPPPQ